MKLPRDESSRRAIAAEVIKASRRSLRALELDLAVGIVYEGVPPGRHYKLDYDDLGQRAWRALRREFYAKLCDRRMKRPRAWLGEVLDGDVRNLALGILSAVVSTYDVSLGIGVPATALILKQGLTKFCASPSLDDSSAFSSLLRKSDRKPAKRTADKPKRPPNMPLQPASRRRARTAPRRP